MYTKLLLDDTTGSEILERNAYTYVRASDADRVEPRRLFVGIQNRVRDETHRGFDRKYPGAARDILLEDVVLNRSGQCRRADTLAFAGGDSGGINGFAVQRSDESGEERAFASGVVLRDGDEIQTHTANGGGWGNSA